MIRHASARTAGWLALALCAAAAPAALASDTLGVWFDAAATVDTLRTTAAQESVTIRLVLRDPGAREWVSGWECAIEARGGGAGPLRWTIHEGINVDVAPNFQVGITTPFGMAVAPTMVLATGRLAVASPDSTVRIYLRPYWRPSLETPPGSGYKVAAPAYVADADPADLRPLAWPVASPALPVAVINPRATGPVRSVAPAALAWGLVPLLAALDRPFEIANVGSGLLVGSVAPIYGTSFRILDAGKGLYELGPGEVRRFGVRFQPLLPGEQRTTIPDADNLLLTGAGFVPGVCAIDDPDLDFGEVALGQRPRLVARIRNAGGGPVVGEVPPGCGPFVVVEGAGPFFLPEGTERAVVVEFAPLAPGAAACALELGTACGAIACVALAIDAPPLCRISPNPLICPLVAVGDSSQAVLTITNGGGGSLAGDCALAGLPAEYAQFALVAGAGPYALLPGQTHAVVVRYSPLAAGQAGCLLLTGADGCDTVAVSGSSFASGCLVSPTSVAFPDTRLDQTAYAIIRARNIGSSELRLAPRVAGAGFWLTGLVERTLPPGGYTDYFIAFTPIEVGEATGALVFDGPCGIVALRGLGLPPGSCRPWPAALDFGTPATLYQDLTTTVRNYFAMPLVVNAIVLPETTQFHLIGPTTATLPPGESFTLTVRFEPRILGRHDALLRFIGMCAASEVALTGFAATVPPFSVLTPDTLDFGLVPLGTAGAASLVVSNGGGGILEGNVLPPTADGLGLLGGGGPFALAGGETRTVNLRYAPPAAGRLLTEVDLSLVAGHKPLVRGFGTVPGGDIVAATFDLEHNTRVTTRMWEPVTALLTIDASSLPTQDVSRLELGVKVQGNVAAVTWRMASTGEAFLGDTQDLVLDGPWPAGPRVLLAAVTFLQAFPNETTRILVRPPQGATIPRCAAYRCGADSAGSWRALVPSSGAWDLPVALVNPGFVGVAAPTPLAAVANGAVRLTWPCDGEPGDRFAVWRRAGDAAPRLLTPEPLACGPSGGEFLDLPDAASRALPLRYSCAVLRDGVEIARGAEVEVAPLAVPPAATALHPVFPNPFNPRATVRFDLARPGRARVTVFDLAGRRVRTLCDAELPAGEYARVWDGLDDRGQPQPSGTYYARLAVDGAVELRKMALIR